MSTRLRSSSLSGDGLCCERVIVAGHRGQDHRLFGAVASNGAGLKRPPIPDPHADIIRTPLSGFLNVDDGPGLPRVPVMQRHLALFGIEPNYDVAGEVSAVSRNGISELP